MLDTPFVRLLKQGILKSDFGVKNFNMCKLEFHLDNGKSMMVAYIQSKLSSHILDTIKCYLTRGHPMMC